jgi:hypothetical protein
MSMHVDFVMGTAHAVVVVLMLQKNPLPEKREAASSPIFAYGSRPARANSLAEDFSIQVSSSSSGGAAAAAAAAQQQQEQQEEQRQEQQPQAHESAHTPCCWPYEPASCGCTTAERSMPSRSATRFLCCLVRGAVVQLSMAAPTDTRACCKI